MPKPPPYPPPPDYPPIVDVHRDSSFSKEQAIEAAKRLVVKYEQLDLEAKVDIAADVKETFAPPSILLIPEMSEDDPAYSTTPADLSTCEDLCAGGCGFKAAKDKSFGGYCCGKCWYYANDPSAGK